MKALKQAFADFLQEEAQVFRRRSRWFWLVLAVLALSGGVLRGIFIGP